VTLSHEFRFGLGTQSAPFHPDPEALRYIPAGFAFRHDVLPYGVDGTELLVAVPDGEPSTVDRIRLLTGMRVRAMPVARELIRKQLAVAYGGARNRRFEGDTSSSAVRVLDEIHEGAIRSRASDVHIEPYARGGRVRQRIDGRLQEVRVLEERLHAQIVSRVKVLAEIDVAERRQPQDGRYSLNVDSRTIDARVSAISTIDGERVVIRLFDWHAERPRLDLLGMDIGTLERCRSLMGAPHGFVVVCGPTGSGKSTTLYAALSERTCDAEHVCTIEDPIEMHLPGIAQMQVNVRAGLTFARALRSILRQDPDVVMVGEMRDAETAGIASSAALAGQLVLTTLHSRDAARAIEKLMDLGVARHTLGAALTGIIAQRLVRTKCSSCVDGAGCQDCFGMGFSGRTGMFECVAISEELRSAISSGSPAQQLRHLIERDACGSLARDGLRHVMAGRTTAAEVERVLGERIPT